MIKPDTLRHLFEHCPSDQLLGKICRALGGQEVSLDDSQKELVNMVLRDSESMDDRAEKKREYERNKKRRQREKPKDKNDPECPEGHMGTQGDNDGHPSVPSLPSIRPSIRPSVHPTNQVETDHVTVPPARSKSKPESVDWSRVKCAVDEDFFDPIQDPALQAAKLIGDHEVRFRRYARGWIDRNGDEAFRTELFEFHREIAAGEEPNDRAKAFTARLSKKDKSKTA